MNFSFIPSLPLKEVVKIIVLSFKFDMFLMAHIFILPILSLQINYLTKFRIYRYFWLFFPIICSFFLIPHLFSDLLYFQNSNKHLGYEGFVFFHLKDLSILFQSILIKNILGTVFFVVVYTLFIFVTLYYFKRIVSLIHIQFSLRNIVFNSIASIAFTLFFIRGGFQKSPLSPSDSIVSENIILNNISLNSFVTTYFDFKQLQTDHLQFIELQTAIDVVQNNLSLTHENFISENFPLLQKKRLHPSIKNNPNIILLILESWTSKFTTFHKYSKINNIEVTPFFNELSKGSVRISHFYATGGRTTNGLVSILTGIPDRPGLSIFHSRHSLNHFSSIANLLQSIHYDTNFIYGGDLNFEGIQPVLTNWGFKNITDIKDIKLSSKHQKGVWGLHDREYFNFVLQTLDQKSSQPPFFLTLLTLSSHHPFSIPNDYKKKFDSSISEFEYLNSLSYADESLKYFFNSIEKYDFFENTIFILVSDHTHHTNLSYIEDREIPFLIYSPKYIQPKFMNFTASQVDILPTVLELIREPLEFSSIGKNILSTDNHPNSSYFAYGNIFGWIEKNSLFVDTIDKPNGLFLKLEDSFLENTPCSQTKNLCDEFQLKAKAYLNLINFLYTENKIYPNNLNY